jgi:hypothetical protein
MQKNREKVRFLFLPAIRTVAGLTTAAKCFEMKPLCDLKSQKFFLRATIKRFEAARD